MENENFIIKSSNQNSYEMVKSILDLNEVFASENSLVNKLNNKNEDNDMLELISNPNLINLRKYSSGISCNLESLKKFDLNSRVANLTKRNSFLPNKNQINKFNSVARKSCFTKFDIIKYEKKQSQYIDEEIYKIPLKSKQEKDQIRKELVKDLFRKFGKNKKIKNINLNEDEQKEIIESEQNKKVKELNFVNLILYPTEVLTYIPNRKKSSAIMENANLVENKNYEKTNFDKEISNNHIINFQDCELKVEEDDGIFFKKKIEEIQVYIKKEKESQERRNTLMLNKNSKNNILKKKVSIFCDSGKIKHKWFSKMTEDEYDDFIIKTKSEHLQKLSKIRNNKKTKALDFEGFLKEKVKLEKNKTKDFKLSNDIKNKNKHECNKDYYNTDIIKNNDEISNSLIHEKSLDEINEETKSSRFSAFEDLTGNENFKNILNAQSMQEKEMSNSYFFGNNNIIIKKENEDQVLVCASKTISKNKSNGTTIIIGDLTKNTINSTKKKSNKTEDNKNKVPKKKDEYNPLKLIKFDEKDDNLSSSIHKKRENHGISATYESLKTKENDKNNGNINNFKSKSFAHKLTEYTEKKEQLENLKKFEKLKKLSYLVKNVKSNKMRSLKTDFVIYQQNQKEKKDKLISEYLEEENKIMESNNIENENIFNDENPLTLKKNREILKYVKYKDIPKLDGTMLKNTIYNNKINQINFLQDSYIVPDFRNKVVRYPENYEEILVDENLIEKFSKLFLTYKKQVYQKDLDEKEKFEELIKDNIELNEKIELSGQSNFIKLLRDRKNDLFQDNYKKFKNRNYEYLNSFKFKYNRKKTIEFPNDKVNHIIGNVYEINMFEKEDDRLFNELKSYSDSKIHSEDLCLSNGNNREENLQKFLKCYSIDVE